jgi:hypothetical protein
MIMLDILCNIPDVSDLECDQIHVGSQLYQMVEVHH